MKFERIEKFKELGLGIFVHFGTYSLIKKGEWYYDFLRIEDGMSDEKYQSLSKRFKVNKNWAKNLVNIAKKAGAKYITLTTRHHEGFSLYDACGLNDYDAPHSASHRDLIKEFVDECNKAGIIPFFYHTLLDWYNKDYNNDFPKYIDYLVKSVEILCKNYGKIGGFWFDGFWNKPQENWQFDRLYGVIRKYQPDAMIINNTGTYNQGEIGHYEIDSVTFERGAPAMVPYLDGKERAGEVCDSLTDHWGYTENDLNIKSIPFIINELVDCRANRCNFLINIGPLPNGNIRPIEKDTLLEFGKWVKRNKHLVFECVPADIKADNAFIFKDDKYYYAVVKNVPMAADVKLTENNKDLDIVIHTDKKIINPVFMDTNKQKIKFNKDNSYHLLPFRYGTSLVARVIRFKLK